MTDEEYKKDQIKKLDRIVIGNEDGAGRKIYDVYTRGDFFVIYSTIKSGSIKGVAISINTHSPDDRVPIDHFQKIKSDFDKLKRLSDRCPNNSYSSRVAHAISVALLGDPEDAKTILQEIYKNIETDYAELVLGKLTYIVGAFTVALLVCGFGLYLYFVEPPFILSKTTFYELVLTCSMSTLGGLISITRNLSKIDVDKGLGKWPYLVYGIERNIFSVLGGVFMFFLVKSNLFLGFIVSTSNPMAGMLVVGFLAGFSETLVPNTLKNLEDTANERSSPGR